MLYDFLLANKDEILHKTELKTIELADNLPSSDQLKQGLPIFLGQLLAILQLQRSIPHARPDKEAASNAAQNSNESGIANASGKPEEASLAASAGLHGVELLRLGYTLSHVIHAYGAICQAVTEVANEKNFAITAAEFHEFNQCLDVAIAGAVNGFQNLRNAQETTRETKDLGFLAHEMRNALTSASLAFQIIKRGTVGPLGSTGQVVDKSLRRLEDLIAGALTEVRLRIDPKLSVKTEHLLRIVDEILVTARAEAELKNQKINVDVDAALEFEADQQTFYSALSNVIQNAIKYTRPGGRIEIRGRLLEGTLQVEVEDQCGGLLGDGKDLFKPFVQKNENRIGLGLGLTIAKRAIELNHGEIEAQNIPGRGCIFKMTLSPPADPKNFKNVIYAADPASVH